MLHVGEIFHSVFYVLLLCNQNIVCLPKDLPDELIIICPPPHALGLNF